MKIVKLEVAIPESWYKVLDGIAQSQIRTQNNVFINILYRYLKANNLIKNISMTELISIVHDAEVALSNGGAEVVKPKHVEVSSSSVEPTMHEKVQHAEPVEKPPINDIDVDFSEEEEEDDGLNEIEGRLDSIKDDREDEENKEESDTGVSNDVFLEPEEPGESIEEESDIPDKFLDKVKLIIETKAFDEKQAILDKIGWDQTEFNKALQIYEMWIKDPDTWEPHIANIDNGINTIDEVYKLAVEVVEASENNESIEGNEETEENDVFAEPYGEENNEEIPLEGNDEDTDEGMVNLPEPQEEEENNEDEKPNKKTKGHSKKKSNKKDDDGGSRKKPSISDIIDSTLNKLK